MSDTPQKAPSSGVRRHDAERSKALLLDAALAEFASKGYAGARVGEIAERAGVNKQLISHYFGGKHGLYRAIVAERVQGESTSGSLDVSLGELTVQYLEYGHGHPESQRLGIREAFDEDVAQVGHDPDPPGLHDLRARQDGGEIAAGFDPAFVLLLLQGIVVAGTVFPGDVKRLTGMDPSSAEYLEYMSGQIRLLAARLA